MTYLLLLLQALTHFETTEYAVKSSKGSKISNNRMCVCQYASVCMLNHTGAYKARTCWVYVVFNSILFVREWVVYVMHPAYVWLPNVTHLGFPVVQTLQLHNQLRACLWQYSPYFAVLTFICIGPFLFLYTSCTLPHFQPLLSILSGLSLLTPWQNVIEICKQIFAHSVHMTLN